MSTFNGVVDEYPSVSIDRFSEKNYTSTTYFLSHCHKDHMWGLSDEKFFQLLKSRGFSKIYVSDVSSHLLKHDEDYQHLSDYLVELYLEQPTLIDVYDEKGTVNSRVTVTLLTAGHCPGSVMFFLEGDNGNVLYTGDFRLPIGSAARLKNLRENNGCLKPLRSLYVDTTFCKENCLYIPSREECLNAIVAIVEPWISRGPNHIVHFLCPYQLAYEFVFVELYNRFGVKTHVTDELEKKYTGIKLIEDAITSNTSEARIHACILDNKNDSSIRIRNYYPCETPCGFASPDGRPVLVRKIKPSAMFFTNSKFPSISEYICKINLYRVFYSTHPSLSEIRDMVNHLKPERVYPNVVRNQTVDEILDAIFHLDERNLPESTSQHCSLSPLGKLKSPSPKETPSQENDSLELFDDCYKISIKKSTSNLPARGTLFSRHDHNIELHTDYENTDELETMLREEICSQSVAAGKCPKIDDCGLKLEYPILSSDEDIFGTSDSSSEDKDRDIVSGTSQDDNIESSCEKNDDPNAIACNTSQQSCSSGSVKSSPSQSLINESCIKYLFKSDIIRKKLTNEEFSQIDLEYSKISEVDNGVGNGIFIKDSERTSKKIPSKVCTNDLKHGTELVQMSDKVTTSSDESQLKIYNNYRKDNQMETCGIKFARSVAGLDNSPHMQNIQNDKQEVHIPDTSKFVSDNSSQCSALPGGSNRKNPHYKSKYSKTPNTRNEIESNVDYSKVYTKENKMTKDFCLSSAKDNNNTALKYSNHDLGNICKINVLGTTFKKENATQDKSVMNSKASESGFKIIGQRRPKSFHCVKKMDSSSDSEDEHNFQYVIKLSDKNRTNSPKNEHKNCNGITIGSKRNEEVNNNLAVTEQKSKVTDLSVVKSSSVRGDCYEKCSVKASDIQIKEFSIQSKENQNNEFLATQNQPKDELRFVSEFQISSQYNPTANENFLGPTLNKFKDIVGCSLTFSSTANSNKNSSGVVQTTQVNSFDSNEEQSKDALPHNSLSKLNFNKSSCQNIEQFNYKPNQTVKKDEISVKTQPIGSFNPIKVKRNNFSDSSSSSLNLSDCSNQKNTKSAWKNFSFYDSNRTIPVNKKRTNCVIRKDNFLNLGSFRNSSTSTNDSYLKLNSSNSPQKTITKYNFSNSCSFSLHSERDKVSVTAEKDENPPNAKSGMSSTEKMKFGKMYNKDSQYNLNSSFHSYSVLKKTLSSVGNSAKAQSGSSINADKNKNSLDEVVNKLLDRGSNSQIVLKSEPSSKGKFFYGQRTSHFINGHEPNLINENGADDISLSSKILSITKDEKSTTASHANNYKNSSHNSNKLSNNVDTEYTSSGDSPEIIFDCKVDKQIIDEPNSFCQKKNSTLWEIKSVSQSSTSSSVIVEEIFSSSDLEDSPSLIAPVIPRTSCSYSNASASLVSKKRKIEFGKSSFNRNDDCDRINDDCDNCLKDSDSTPELFENKLSNIELSVKKLVPEIVIDDDDDDDWL